MKANVFVIGGKELSDEEREQIFSDLFDKALEDAKDAITRSAMLLPDPDGAPLFIGGVVTSLAGSMIGGHIAALTSRGDAGDYLQALATVEGVENALLPDVVRLRTLVEKGRDENPEVAKALAENDMTWAGTMAHKEEKEEEDDNA